MYISQETPAATDRRLRRVIQQAHLTFYPRSYYFAEYPIADYVFNPTALAVVRDDEVVSELVAGPQGQGENRERAVVEYFGLFRFHFPEEVDNSGFVGWLATLIKRELGAGVFVVCGQHTGRGGIFDYWGCPWEVREAVFGLVRNLHRGEREL